MQHELKTSRRRKTLVTKVYTDGYNKTDLGEKFAKM
jgi:hypothetical protein